MNRPRWSSEADFEAELRSSLASASFGEEREGLPLCERLLRVLRGRTPRQLARDRLAGFLQRTSGLVALVLILLFAFLVTYDRTSREPAFVPGSEVPGDAGSSLLASSPKATGTAGEEAVMEMLDEGPLAIEASPSTVLAFLLVGD
ncbi:MAG: hypothetical protein AB1486_01820 [Planctomycetota bacterium]